MGRSGEGQGLMGLVLILVLGWGLLYLPALGTRELQGEEARRVLPGRTMLQTGDWVVPRSAGKIYNRKPPLINWATAWAIKLTGRMDEWSVRLPSVLGMLALALTVLLAGRVWLGNEGAFLAACVCLTNIGFLEKGRLAEIEGIYMALFGMALMVWLAAWWKDWKWLAWVGSMLLLGVGFLAKGPVHVWYFYAIVIGVLWAEGRLRELLSVRHWVGVAVFVSVWLPWAMANSGRNPQKDSGKVWMEQVTHRMGLVEFDWLNWVLQVPQSVMNFLPWAVLLPLAWSGVVTGQWPGMGRRGLWLKGLRAGLVMGFLVIALLPSSRPRFMLPLNVAAAVLVVECWALLPLAARGRWVRGWLAVLVGVGV
jgi:4-amino-4-deoxy-L-arabinose transferase-like glycosyltransferase